MNEDRMLEAGRVLDRIRVAIVDAQVAGFELDIGDKIATPIRGDVAEEERERVLESVARHVPPSHQHTSASTVAHFLDRALECTEILLEQLKDASK